MQRSIRFPDGLDARIRARAKADDRSFSYVVLRALESALGGAEESERKPLDRSASAPSRAPKAQRLTEAQSVKAQADWMLERQRKLNERKS